jgi:hypothetical protein
MFWTLGPQLVMLFWEVVETFGGGALLEEVGPWGCAFEVYTGSSVPFSLPLGCQEVKDSLHHMLPRPWCFPQTYEAKQSWPEPSEIVSQNKIFLPLVALSGILVTAMQSNEYRILVTRRVLGQRPNSGDSNISGLTTHPPNMPNKETSSNEGQKKVICECGTGMPWKRQSKPNKLSSGVQMWA